MGYFDDVVDLIKSKLSKLNQDDQYYYFYKHIAFDKDLEILKLFENEKLLYTKPTHFNDPYDCYCEIDYDFEGIKRDCAEFILKRRITNKEFKLYRHKYIDEIKNIPEIKNWGDIGRNNGYTE